MSGAERRHVIVDEPMRCFNQLVAAHHMAEAMGATVHMTARCLGKPTRKRPGMGSSCMPARSGRGGDKCRHDLTELRGQGAVDVSSDIECWTDGPVPCTTCGGVERSGVVESAPLTLF
jgi:hypothetical protein